MLSKSLLEALSQWSHDLLSDFSIIGFFTKGNISFPLGKFFTDKIIQAMHVGIVFQERK